jgi:flagellar assembly protein FliH
MSEAVKLSLAQYFGDRSGFRPRDLRSSMPQLVLHAQDPYALGLADGQQMAEAAFGVERKQLHALIAAADVLAPEGNAEIAFMLDNIIRSIVTKIVGDLPIDATLLAQQIKVATGALTEADNNRHLRMHPEDLVLLANVDLPLSCSADPNLPRGAMRIECSDGWIEHGPTLALERLADMLSNDGGLA